MSGRGSADGGVYIDTLGEITNNPTVPGPAEFGGVAYLCLIRCFRLVTAGP